MKRVPVTPLLAAVWCLCGCQEQAVNPSDPPGNAGRGGRLLAQYHCGSCHTIPGVASARGRVAVTLESFGPRSYIAGRMPNTPKMLEQWLMDPQTLVPGTAMPHMGVSAADAKDMAAYLGKLK